MAGLGVLLVDDHVATVLGLRALLGLQTGAFEVVGSAADGTVAVERAQQLRPALACVDIHLEGDLDGFEVCSRLRGLAVAPAVVMYTASTSARTLTNAQAAGAIGVVAKADGPAEIVRALELAAAGRPFTSPRLLAASPPAGLSECLTGREQQVLELLAQGLHNDQIAERLGIGVESVRTYLKQVRAKLGAVDRAHAVKSSGVV